MRCHCFDKTFLLKASLHFVFRKMHLQIAVVLITISVCLAFAPQGEKFANRPPTGDEPERPPMGDEPKRLSTGDDSQKPPMGDEAKRPPSGDEPDIPPEMEAQAEKTKPKRRALLTRIRCCSRRRHG